MNNIESVIDKKDYDFGGVAELITGTPGCGKSNALAKIGLLDLKKGIIVMWRAKNTCQWSIFLNTDVKLVFWLKKNIKYKLYDRDSSKEIDFERFGKVTRWENSNELIKGLEKNVINIIYTETNPNDDITQMKFCKEWLSIIYAMISRLYSDAITLLFDELEDLAPESKPGFYQIVTNTANIIKELRKNLVHFFGATHKITEIFWVVRNKIEWLGFMRGATTPSKSKVKSLSNLKQGDMIIENNNRFDFVHFELVGKPKNFILEIVKLNNK